MPKLPNEPAAPVPASPVRIDAPPPGLSWQDRREYYRRQLQEKPFPGFDSDDLDAHCALMPPRYWERVTADDLVWALAAIHGFLSLMAAPNASATAPHVQWHEPGAKGITRVMLCTWDRHGLLAKAAAAFSAVRLNILRADVYTRADHLVLDVFEIMEGDGRAHIPDDRLRRDDGAAGRRAQRTAPLRVSLGVFTTQIPFSAQRPGAQRDVRREQLSNWTLVQVEAGDWLGLLYDVLQALADSGIEITQARIETDHGRARDVLHVTGAHGEKIIEPGKLAAMRAAIESALNATETTC